MRSAFTPVVSAAVSSVTLPMPMNSRHIGPPAVGLGVAFDRRGEAEADRLDHGIDEARPARLFDSIQRGWIVSSPAPKSGMTTDARARAGEVSEHVADRSH